MDRKSPERGLSRRIYQLVAVAILVVAAVVANLVNSIVPAIENAASKGADQPSAPPVAEQPLPVPPAQMAAQIVPAPPPPPVSAPPAGATSDSPGAFDAKPMIEPVGIDPTPAGQSQSGEPAKGPMTQGIVASSSPATMR